MSMFASKADYEAACAELKSSNHEKTVFDIKSDPSLVLQLKDGDKVSVDGIILDVVSAAYKQWIYFRTVDSRTKEYQKNIDEGVDFEYSDYMKHLREGVPSIRKGRARMTREEFKLILESGNYYIG
jgi:hypothetical protein